MDFFEYASIALQFVKSDTLYVPLIVGALCFLAVFIFEAIGLYSIAGHEGYAHKWMAFIPFVNTYYIGVCGQKNRVFKSVNTKYVSLAAAILEFVLFVGYVVYFTAFFRLYAADCLHEGDMSFVLLNNFPLNLAWAAWCFEFLYDYVLIWLSLVFFVLRVFVLSAFFQTYSARRYFLFTITSVLFPVQGILIFIVRNNSGMSYTDFMRREQERQYRMYQQYVRQNPDADPYNQNPYSRGGNGDTYNRTRPSEENKTSHDDPFSDFNGGKGNSDPFDL